MTIKLKLFSLAVSSAALYLIFELMHLKEKQEVILSPLTNDYVVALIRYFKAIPVFCDLKENNLVMDWEDLENKITPNTKFIIVSHHFGIPFPWENLKTIDKNIVLLEDLNNGLGSKLNGELLGSKGLFSFFFSKF